MSPVALSFPDTSLIKPWKKTAGAIASVVLVTAVASAATTVPVGVAFGLVFGVLVRFLPMLRTHVRARRLKLGVVRSAGGATFVTHEGATPSKADVVVAHVLGPLTFLSQGQIHALVEGPPWPSYLLLELSGVPFVDAGGINELEYLTEFLELRGTRVMLVRASARTTQALERAEALRCFVGKCVYPSLDDALAVVARAAGIVCNKPEESRKAGLEGAGVASLT